MTSEMIQVTKRDGRLENLDIEKIHRVVSWAAEGLDVSPSEVELKAQIQLYNGIHTEAIHATLIKSAADLISLENPDYQYMAARLAVFNIRKIAYGEYTPPRLYTHIHSMIEKGIYDKEILEKYTEAEIDLIESFVDHNRDMNFAYAGIKQMESKYLVQNRVTKRVYESPQIAFILIPTCLFADYPKETRIDYIKKFYNALSLFKISLPTPIMAGVRTPTKQFSSCTVVPCDDSLDSINAATSAIVKYISQRAGIGINGGRIRALGSEIRKGEAIHTGVIPFWKMFQAAVKSCSQGGIRGGAATLFYPIWHLEVESLLVLKNNRGVEDNRIRQLDYGVQINKLMYQRLIEDKDITLFSPHSVEGLYDAYFNDQELFEKLYLEAESNPLIPKKTIKATELFTLLMSERANTGRIYIMNVDHSNTHSSFIEKEATIYTSNLCVSGDTKVMTDKGMVKIGEHVGEKFTIWNGFEWSEGIEFVKTNTNQDLYRVELSNGRFLDCTSEHKWITYGKQDYDFVRRNSVQRVATKDLKIGDWLQKWDSTVIDGDIELDKAYSNGFYTADGCDVGNANLIYLYHAKRKLFKTISKEINSDIISVGKNNDRITIRIRTKVLKPKYFVPDSSYTVKSRLDWFAGFMDGDGVVFRNDGTTSLSFSSVNKDFCNDVMDMLLSLGVTSRFSTGIKEGMRILPDGKGGKKQYMCKTTYRVVISSNGLSKLIDLGIKFNRLVIPNNRRIPNRCATHFVKVKSITKLEGKHDTFCVFEPKNNSVIFNGIMTGNCMEITLPTKPLNNILDEEGEIALCTLGALNLGTVDKDKLEDIEESMDLIVRALDSILDYQNYPVKAARNSVDKYRPLGIGVINYAYYLAKNGARYSNASGHKLTHELFEAIQYYALKSSVQLAKEKGKCKAFENTKYSKGILPIDTYKKSIDEFASFDYRLDWESLRKDIVEYGLRNATLTSLMPSESSSQVSNATNGIDLPRGPITVKASKDGILKQVVPEYERLAYDYEYLWYDSSNIGMLKLVAIMQKFVDQSISTNTRYNPANYPNGKVPMKEMLKELLLAYKYGVKTLYYHHTNDGSDDTQDSLDDGCAGGACKI